MLSVLHIFERIYFGTGGIPRSSLGGDIQTIYDMAVKDEFSFLCLKPSARKVDDMFWLRFEKRCIIGDDGEDDDI